MAADKGRIPDIQSQADSVVPAKVYGFWRLVGARWCKQRLGVARVSRDMLIKLHKNATTTPRQRAYIQASDKSVADLAGELGVSAMTVRRWKTRRDTADRPSTPHRLATRFTPEKEEIKALSCAPAWR